MALTEQEARKMAEEKVYVYMTFGDIQDACREFGIKVVKSRHTMEQELIDAYVKKVDRKGGRLDGKILFHVRKLEQVPIPEHVSGGRGIRLR